MRLFITMALILLGHNVCRATHLRGAEIRYTHLSENTYHIQLQQYTSIASPIDYHQAVFVLNGLAIDTLDRDSVLEVDGFMYCASGIKIDFFNAEFTFPGNGNYVITFEDPNRDGGIMNIPNSIDQSLCVSATLVISPTTGHNNSVVFQNPQYIIDPYYMNGPSSWFLAHSLNAYDADGDSLSFEAVAPLGIGCSPIPGYQFPNSQFSSDAVTGDWQMTASQIGDYVIAIKATEWRNGQIVGQVMRDMMICVFAQVGIEDVPVIPFINISNTLTNGQIRITSSRRDIHPLSILDASGRILITTTIHMGEHWLDLSHLNNGVYLVRIMDAKGGNFTTRIVKQ